MATAVWPEALGIVGGAITLVVVLALAVTRRHRRFVVRATFEVERRDDD